MPSPSTPHRPSNLGGNTKSTPGKQKPLDIGQPLGIYDTNSVREKVRKWQQQGGGVITADEVVYYEEDEENSTVSSKSKPTRTATRKRSKSTPRKRVISDEHWKLNRTPTQAPALKLPPPKRLSQYTTNDQPRTPRVGRNESRKEDKTRLSPSTRSVEREKAGSDSRSRERRRSKVYRDGESLLGSKIGEETTSHNGSTKSGSRPTSAGKPHAGGKSELADDAAKKGSHKDDDDCEWAASDADFSELSRRRARGPNPTAKVRAPPPKIPKGGIFEHMLGESRKIFAKPEPPKPSPNRGSKIEAWLSGTSDPFFDEVDPDVEVPAPLNTKGNRAKLSTKREEGRSHVTDSGAESDSRRKSTSKRRVSSREDRVKSMTEEIIASQEPEKETASILSEKRSAGHKHSRSSSSNKENASPEKKEPDEVQDMTVTETQAISESSEISEKNAPTPLHRERPVPTTGDHRLSTIASVESMKTGDEERSQAPATDAPPEECDPASAQRNEDQEERDQFDPNSLPVVSSQLKRRLTTHDDLMSVLSAPNSRSRSIKSARSIRTNKSRITSVTVSDLLKELSADEAKYMRELKTLVGGVIPVLLTCVLSKSDSAIAAGLFRPSMDPEDELNFSKPIVDMGVAVERLKTLHKRIPQDNADSLLTWAQGAQKVYRDYLNSWRLGFKDVIVNLAPLDESEAMNNADTKSLDEGMARDENGDVVDSDGEKVDVAYLLKRPLVRLKYLAKTFKGINMLQPSEQAEDISMAYQNLVTDARRRAREERARLEDESATSIDPSRARDLETLGPLAGVTINRSRRVRARDFFNLSLYHSTGQVIDCRAELLLRDNAAEKGVGGDLLICEIDHADRWLLFPPMDLAFVSARNGDMKGEIVVMLRSPPGQPSAWQEILVLRIDEEDIGFEWVQMLGLNPVPPAICRSQSFAERAKQRQRAHIASSSTESSTQEARQGSTSDDIPIGEKAVPGTLRRSSGRENLSEPSTVGSSLVTESRTSLQTAITRESDYAAGEVDLPTKPSSRTQPSILHSRDPRKIPTGDERSPTSLKRSKARRIARHDEENPPVPGLPNDPNAGDSKGAPVTHRPDHDEKKAHKEHQPPKSPTKEVPEAISPRVSSVPSMDLPIIPKLRKGSSPRYISESLASTPDDEYVLDSYNLPESPTRRKEHSHTNSDTSEPTNGEEPPPPPPHSRSPSSTGSSLSNAPVLSPTGPLPRRRGSSPLKHEYEPSTASDEAYSDSDTSTVRRYDLYSESDYSGSDSSDEDSEDELPPLQEHHISKLTTPASVITSATSSLSPSNSVSQGGYRSVPSQPHKSSTVIASVFAWSDKGSWESLVPDECKICVSPGLVEAYDVRSASASGDDGPGSEQERPLIALELTPLVPIRRGTAIDISIRSPPTERSKVTWSSNTMFRSRNADECEALYSLINQARINNPTYIALQNARGPFTQESIPLERPPKSGGLFGWPRRRKSYRASSSPRSLADNSESSVGTMTSAFSALKRFGAGSKMFSIARSSVTSRNGQKEDSLYSSSAGSGTNHTSTSGIGRIAAAIKNVDGIGLSNAKIRLYVRETQSKWRDMGAARLTIMPATTEPRRPEAATGGPDDASTGVEGVDGSPPASGAASPRRTIDSEKRILIRGKTRGEVLLDVCLPESSFERVARTGIAVSVWEETEGGTMPKKGGVTGGTSKIYMIQMKSEAEAAYTFGLVGKLRY
ncbi:hypothetical protein BDV28DRAFT_23134 [Aspergillus coremiiformis]|uniref:DH domain-containing protein n=1 Tax=Aspergillus coremiiformis TaxID=138285 RepID=A0A5N6Z0R3_9EURO|nr:hypothetical protein BDV28DRAFT_23134 [Aspergillus coremiiformis]